MSEFKPHIPPGVHRFERTCPHKYCYAQIEIQFVVTNDDGGAPEDLVPGVEKDVSLSNDDEKHPTGFWVNGMWFQSEHCGCCGREVIITPHIELWTRHYFAMIMAALKVVVPVLSLDYWIGQGMNRVSDFLQRLTGASKYHLALVSYLAGFVCLVLTGDGSVLNTAFLVGVWGFVLWDYVLLCLWRIWSGADDDGSGDRFAADHALSQRCVMTRAGLMVIGLVLFPFALLAGTPIAFAFLLVSCGHYFLSSDHLPPDKRYLFDLARKFAGQSST
jgi:hypothetical protein